MPGRSTDRLKKPIRPPEGDEPNFIMESFKTVSTLERIVRNGIVTAMLIGFAGWSFYDGYVKYPNDNLKQSREQLPPDLQASARINPRVDEIKAQTFKKGNTLDDIVNAFGPPDWRGDYNKKQDKVIWFGRSGALVAHVDNLGLTKLVEWKSGKHKETDLHLQKMMGIVLAPLGLFMLIRLIAMSVRGAKFSDEGLTPSGRKLITFDSMTGWNTEQYADRGQIMLEYDSANGKASYLLDDYKLAAFKTIVNEISKRKGFDNPLDAKSTDETAKSSSST